jgi:hypothetical protein
MNTAAERREREKDNENFNWTDIFIIFSDLLP